MLFRETDPVYCENRREYTDTRSFSMLKQVVCIVVTTGLLKG
jgi:hypothetical protein